MEQGQRGCHLYQHPQARLGWHSFTFPRTSFNVSTVSAHEATVPSLLVLAGALSTSTLPMPAIDTALHAIPDASGLVFFVLHAP